MGLLFGKAMSGGIPLNDDEIDNLARDHLVRLRQTFARPSEIEKTDDVLSLRLAEELRLLQRVIDLVQRESSGSQSRELLRAEEALEDLAEVVEANERCEAIRSIDPEIARRLRRSTIDGAASPCSTRRSS